MGVIRRIPSLEPFQLRNDIGQSCQLGAGMRIDLFEERKRAQALFLIGAPAASVTLKGNHFPPAIRVSRQA
jgi:hypothetical protein